MGRGMPLSIGALLCLLSQIRRAECTVGAQFGGGSLPIAGRNCEGTNEGSDKNAHQENGAGSNAYVLSGIPPLAPLVVSPLFSVPHSEAFSTA
jgi:hypothetical protein